MIDDRPSSVQIRAMIKAHWLKAGLAFLVVFSAMVAAYVVLPARYVATASIIVAQQDHGLDGAKSLSADKVGDPADIESQLLLVRSTRVLRLVIEDSNVQEALARECQARPKLFANLSCSGLTKDMDKLRDAVALRYNVGGAGRSRVINIAYDSPLPNVAQSMANALTTTFLDDRRTTIAARRIEAAAQLRGQLAQLENSLRDDEEAIQKFRREYGLQHGTSAPVSSERLTSTIQVLAQAELGKADATAKASTLNAGEDLTDSASSTAIRAIGDLKQQLTALDAQIANESNILGPRHPVLQSLDRQRSAVKRRLDSELATLEATTKRRMTTANRTASEMANSLGKLKREAADALANETKISAMVREADAKRVRISDVSRRIGELEIQQRTISIGAELVSLADLPTVAFFPKLVPFVAGGLVLGMIAAIATILLAERRRRIALGLDALPPLEPAMPVQDVSPNVPVAEVAPAITVQSGRLRRLGQAHAAIPLATMPYSTMPHLHPGAPFTLHLPLPTATRRGPLAGLAEIRANPQSAEALRAIEASLDLRPGSGRGRVILCAAGTAACGTTMLALGLAEGAAAKGARVLLIEAGADGHGLSQALHLSPSMGLAGVLSGKCSLRDAALAAPGGRFHILPVGVMAPGRAVSLAGPAMVRLLEVARAFDLVLIDAEPENRSPTVAMLAPLVDGILCLGQSTESARQLSARLARVGGRTLGHIETGEPQRLISRYRRGGEWAAA